MHSAHRNTSGGIDGIIAIIEQQCAKSQFQIAALIIPSHNHCSLSKPAPSCVHLLPIDGHTKVGLF